MSSLLWCPHAIHSSALLLLLLLPWFVCVSLPHVTKMRAWKGPSIHSCLSGLSGLCAACSPALSAWLGRGWLISCAMVATTFVSSLIYLCHEYDGRWDCMYVCVCEHYIEKTCLARETLQLLSKKRNNRLLIATTTSSYDYDGIQMCISISTRHGHCVLCVWSGCV
jgi:hypothetical protein